MMVGFPHRSHVSKTPTDFHFVFVTEIATPYHVWSMEAWTWLGGHQVYLPMLKLANSYMPGSLARLGECDLPLDQVAPDVQQLPVCLRVTLDNDLRIVSPTMWLDMPK
jgi:hypothetical protein